ncbi:MAG: hypothetical protein HZB85_01845 [Deltaproteobacteria bacterium]|nr:hypothetical protein [Deltaproteobacteria bacterium]
MANTDTVKAITANLSSILAGLGFKIEDLSTDPSMSATPVCVVLYEGEEFEYGHGQRPLYNEVKYLLKILLNDPKPGTSRDKYAQHVHAIRDAVTVNALNTGDLATSRLVSLVNTTDVAITYEPPVSTIDYRMNVRYREV